LNDLLEQRDEAAARGFAACMMWDEPGVERAGHELEVIDRRIAILRRHMSLVNTGVWP
jgi:hypothetical protein